MKLSIDYLQAVIGHLADIWWSPDRKGVPVFPDVVHQWLGRGLFLASFITMLLGTLRRDADAGAIVVLCLAPVVTFTFHIAAQLWLGAAHSSKSGSLHAHRHALTLLAALTIALAILNAIFIALLLGAEFVVPVAVGDTVVVLVCAIVAVVVVAQCVRRLAREDDGAKAKDMSLNAIDANELQSARDVNPKVIYMCFFFFFFFC